MLARDGITGNTQNPVMLREVVL